MRDYDKIEQENCQLITQHGGKKFKDLHGIAVTKDDSIVMVDKSNNYVMIINKDLKLLRTFGQGDILNSPVGVAVDHNIIAVSEWDNNLVKKFTLQGCYLSKFGSHGSGNGQFICPQGLAFNSKGLLYVVDVYNYRVQVFNNNNNFLFKFGSKPGYFQDPRYIAIDSSDHVYVTDYDGGEIVVSSEDGHFIKR